MKTRSKRFFLRFCAAATICIIIVVAIWLSVKKERQVSAQSDASQSASIPGTVVPAEAVDLGFNASGTIGMVNNLAGDTVASGTVIATLDNAPERADLAEALAALRLDDAELARLEIASGSTTPAQALARLAQAKQALLTTLEASRLSTEDAIYNKSDELFSNPNSSAPQILFFASSTSETSIESGRVEVGARLLDLDTILSQATTTDDLQSLSLSVKEDIAEANLFLDTTALSLNAVGTSSPSDEPIATWQAQLAVAQTEVANAISSIFAADKDLADAMALAADTQSSGPSESVILQESKVAEARAAVAHDEAALRDRSITSPIGGVITRQDAKLGEQAVAGVALVSVMSTGKFQIEAAIPESLLSRIAAGSSESVTLDSYASGAPLAATVISIDTDSTLVDGEPMYKALFQFSSDDARIRSGMTVHIAIAPL